MDIRDIKIQDISLLLLTRYFGLY